MSATEDNTVASFMASLRTPKTKKTYGHALRLVLGDPASFLEAYRQDKKQAENQLLYWISRNTDQKVS